MEARPLTSTETKWTERVAAWRASGQSAEEFAQHKGFKASTLKFWASRLRTSARRPTATSAASPRLVRLVARPASRPPSSEALGAPRGPARARHPDDGPRSSLASADVHVEYGRVRIRVGPGSDLGLLHRVLRALGATEATS